MNGVVPNVAMKYDKTEWIYNIDYEESEITDEIRCSKRPEDIQKCLHAGVLPECYEETADEHQAGALNSKLWIYSFYLQI